MKRIINKYCFVFVTLTLYGLVMMQYIDYDDAGLEEDDIYAPGPMQEYGWNILQKDLKKLKHCREKKLLV